MKNIRGKTALMVRLAVLLAILIIMAYTPLGYLKLGVVEISFLMIPVAIASVVIGPGAGAFMGLVFGITSFIQCFGASQFGVALLGIDPFLTFLVCVPTRVIAGWLPGVIYRAMTKNEKNFAFASVLSSLLAAVLNTVLFVGTLILFFGKTDFIRSIGETAWLVVVAIVGVNGLVEAPVCAIVAGAISRALVHFTNKRK